MGEGRRGSTFQAKVMECIAVVDQGMSFMEIEVRSRRKAQLTI
jgi:hypothetical protein